MEKEMTKYQDQIANSAKSTMRSMCACGIKCADDSSLSPEAFQQCFQQCT